MNRRRFVSGTAAMVSLSGLALTGCQLADTQRPGSDRPVETVSSPPLPSLRNEARKGQLRFGSAVHDHIIAPGTHSRSIVAGQCSSITPEWSMKWNSLAPSGPHYQFADTDACAGFAASHGLAMRGHTLLWHLGTPAWAERHIAANRDWRLVDEHIQRVVTRYRTGVDEWDVVNEPISNTGDGDLRENQFLAAFGRRYLLDAFQSAAAAAPQADLYLNEFGLEYANAHDGQKRLALLRTVERLLNQGAPIHGVGLQAHLDLGKGNIYEQGVFGLMRDLSGMGMKVAITELDVKEEDLQLPIQRRDSLVADTVRRFLETVLQFPAVTSVSTWGLSDAHSWLAYHRGGHPGNRGLPYDRDWRAKPMRTAIASMIGAYRSNALNLSTSS